MIRRSIRRLLAWIYRRLSPDQFDEVREFVYLDEISVRSLLASTGEGGLLTETVEQDVHATRRRRGGGMGVSVGPGQISGTSETEHEVRTSQEERRNYDLIQSKFTQLHNSDAVNTKLSLDQVPSRAAGEAFDGLPVSELERGDLLELRVNLSANLLFRLYQVIDYLGDTVDDEFDKKAKENLRMIKTSLGNAIPIVGTAIDYRVVEEDGGKNIELVDEIDESVDDSQVQDLEIVTLLHLDDLWADPIHTLFNDSEFVIYCRVEDVEIDVWHPLKVTRAIGSLSQDAADELNQLIRTGMAEMRNQLSEMKGLEDWSDNPVAGWSQEIAEYNERLVSEYDITVSDEDQVRLLRLALQNADTSYEDSKTAQRKEVLDAYTDAFIDRYDLDPIGPEKRQELRPASSAPSGVEFDKASSPEEANAFRVEAKTVAVYW